MQQRNRSIMIMCVFFINNCRDVWKKKFVVQRKSPSLLAKNEIIRLGYDYVCVSVPKVEFIFVLTVE